MKFKGEVFEGTHEPLISKKLFDTCQEVMAKRAKRKIFANIILLFLAY